MNCPILPYQIGTDWYIDKDPRSELYYAANVLDDMVAGNTYVASFTADATGVELMEVGLPQGVYGRLLPVKLKGMAAVGSPSFCVFNVVCANGEKFPRTIHFNRVSD